MKICFVFYIENANKAINPYAISNRCDINNTPENYKNDNDPKIRQQQLYNEQQPSTSKNLPDILKRPTKSQNTTNQQLSDSLFNNNNKYLPTKSPLTNRKIPQYSIPNTTFKIQPNIASTPSEDINTTASDHSGGSDVTLPIDERIEYVDA